MTELERAGVNAHNILSGLADFSFGEDGDVTFVERQEDGTNEEHIVANIAKIARLAIEGSEIIESGSNSNGNYIKFTNGELICMGEKNTASTEGDATWIYPMTFTSINSMQANRIGSSANYYAVLSIGSQTLSSVVFRAKDLTATWAGDMPVSFLAIGRWD